MIESTINSVLILKSIRSWFFSIFLVLFSTIIFYIVIETYLKYFLDSLKIIKKKLKLIIKSKNHSNDISSAVSHYDFSNQTHDNKLENNLFKVIESFNLY